jgi:hypothetical protein
METPITDVQGDKEGRYRIACLQQADAQALKAYLHGVSVMRKSAVHNMRPTRHGALDIWPQR